MRVPPMAGPRTVESIAMMARSPVSSEEQNTSCSPQSFAGLPGSTPGSPRVYGSSWPRCASLLVIGVLSLSGLGQHPELEAQGEPLVRIVEIDHEHVREPG